MIVLLIVVTVLLAAYLLALRCHRGHKDLASLRGLAYAHRGLHSEGVPENSTVCPPIKSSLIFL